MHRTLLAIIMMGYTAIALGNNHCTGPDAITDPPQFQWTHHPASGSTEAYYSGRLEMGEASFDVDGDGVNDLTTRAYRQEGGTYTIPGPTIKMTPGNKYVLQFWNNLPNAPLSSATNVFKDPDVTNLHTHGLHISGETPSDDVTRFFEGQTGGDFVYDLSADHMGGTFWYHAHHHGSTFLQVSGGAFGQIIIDDELDGMPENVKLMQEKQLLIAYLDPAVAGTGGDTLMSGTLSPTWTVNGMIAGRGTVCMPPNTWEHWRILLADRDASPKTITVDSQCEVAVMARDGVWRTDSPLGLSPTNSIAITGASRVDLAVRCAADVVNPVISVDNLAVASIAIDGAENTSVHPFNTDGVSTWRANRPTYLREMRFESPVNLESVNVGARGINGDAFDHDNANYTLDANSLQEWSVSARQHPFHLHVYHMQMIDDCSIYEAGEYYDTIAGNCDVRFDLNENTSEVFAGRTILHCHILSHEDRGAMGWINVVNGGKSPPTFPAGTSYQAYYPFNGGGGTGTVMAVDSVTVTTVGIGQGQKIGRAVVVVTDDQGAPVEGAVVLGAFSGTFNEVILDSTPTDATGSTTIDTTESAKGGISLTFCVEAIAAPAGSTLESYSGPQVCGSL